MNQTSKKPTKSLRIIFALLLVVQPIIIMSLDGIDSIKYILVLSSIPLIFIYSLMIFSYIEKCSLKTSLGSAYIHNLDLIDKSKEVI